VGFGFEQAVVRDALRCSSGVQAAGTTGAAYSPAGLIATD